ERHFFAPDAQADVPAGGSANTVVQVTCDPQTPPGLYNVLFQILSADLATDFSGVEFVIEVSDPGPGVDSSITWQSAVPFGIQRDAAADGWNSGRVHDVLSLPGGSLLVGTNRGGIWLAMPSGDAVAHSDDWANPDVNCLERGLDDPNHFYAGCDSGGA